MVVLCNDVLRFYWQCELRIEVVLKDNRCEFCGAKRILSRPQRHRVSSHPGRPQNNGFVECFKGTVLDKFFRIKLRETSDKSLEAL